MATVRGIITDQDKYDDHRIQNALRVVCPKCRQDVGEPCIDGEVFDCQFAHLIREWKLNEQNKRLGKKTEV